MRARAMGRRGKGGEVTSHAKVDGALRTNEFTECDLVQGATLFRFWHKKRVSDRVHMFWVFTPTARMGEIQCDGCVKRHSSKNLDCSATLGAESPMTDGRIMYRFGSKIPVQNPFTMDVTAEGTSECTVTFAQPFVPHPL
jgi:hypothetical protein